MQDGHCWVSARNSHGQSFSPWMTTNRPATSRTVEAIMPAHNIKAIRGRFLGPRRGRRMGRTAVRCKAEQAGREDAGYFGAQESETPGRRADACGSPGKSCPQRPSLSDRYAAGCDQIGGAISLDLLTTQSEFETTNARCARRPGRATRRRNGPRARLVVIYHRPGQGGVAVPKREAASSTRCPAPAGASADPVKRG
jgi:hypothetical protein